MSPTAALAVTAGNSSEGNDLASSLGRSAGASDSCDPGVGVDSTSFAGVGGAVVTFVPGSPQAAATRAMTTSHSMLSLRGSGLVLNVASIDSGLVEIDDLAAAILEPDLNLLDQNAERVFAAHDGPP